MVKKIKMLFDGQLLSRAFIQKQTGIFRVSDEIFKVLSKRDDVELYFLVTNNRRGETEKYLESRGLSHLIPNIVRLPKLLMSTKTRNLYHKIYGGFLRKILPYVYGKKLKEFDVYFSPFPAISPVVKKAGVKTVSFFYDIIPVLYPNFAFVYKSQAKNFVSFVNNINSDLILFDSKSARDDFLRWRYPFDFNRAKICYLAADKRFCKKSDSEIKKVADKYHIPHKPYLFGISEANPRKNFAHVIKSFIEYVEKTGDKNLNLVIAGKKLPGYDYLAECSDKLEKYKDRIILTGYVDDEDIPALYSGASIFMYPSLYEGFGLPLLEAMQCGIPVITADNSSLPEVGGDAVAYVSGFDVIETANMIEKILNDKEFSDDLIKKSLERVKLFSWKETVDIMINEVKKIGV
ncbi:glycosyltransferase family 4 protein [bacterium]|nr:glycosyltransferase family 4 protein [bacterium]